MSKINKFVGKILDKHDALIAESVISQDDLNLLDDSHMEDDPEDDMPADFSDDADGLALDVKCFSDIANSKKSTQFKVSPNNSMVVSLSDFKKLVNENHENLINELVNVNKHLDWFVRAFITMKKKGHKTSEFAFEARQKIPFELNGLENSDAVLTSKVVDLDHKLRKVLDDKKASNVKSSLTANDIKPFIDTNNKIIKDLKK